MAWGFFPQLDLKSLILHEKKKHLGKITVKNRVASSLSDKSHSLFLLFSTDFVLLTINCLP